MIGEEPSINDGDKFVAAYSTARDFFVHFSRRGSAMCRKRTTIVVCLMLLPRYTFSHTKFTTRCEKDITKSSPIGEAAHLLRMQLSVYTVG